MDASFPRRLAAEEHHLIALRNALTLIHGHLGLLQRIAGRAGLEPDVSPHVVAIERATLVLLQDLLQREAQLDQTDDEPLT